MSQKLFRRAAVVALIIGIGKLFHFRAWKMAHHPWAMAGGPEGEQWTRRRPKPPWHRDWATPSAERTEQAEPDAEASAAEAES